MVSRVEEGGFSLAEVSIALALWVILILGAAGILWRVMSSEEVQRNSIAQNLAVRYLSRAEAGLVVGEERFVEGNWQIVRKGTSYTRSWYWEVKVFRAGKKYFELKSIQYRAPVFEE